MGWKEKLEQAKQQGKALADQAQAKLDEAQQQFNDSQAGKQAPRGEPSGGYDKHGRPLGQTSPPDTPPSPAMSAPPAGIPDMPPPASPAMSAPPTGIPDMPPPAATPPPAAGPPPAPTPPIDEAPKPAGTGDVEAAREEQYRPPGLTSGDPLSG